jgi:diguanylate cyclase (GGDEF)-like protein
VGLVEARRRTQGRTQQDGHAREVDNGARSRTPATDNEEPELEGVDTRREYLEPTLLRDPLTRLLSRAALADQLETELARAERGNYPVAVVALDLDYFKQVNDLYGHAVGDRVLVGVAELLSTGLRPGDLCSRFGGDEFVLAFVGANADLATQILTRIGVDVAALEFGPGHGPLSFSAGIAEFPRRSMTVPDLVEEADLALYSAKAGAGTESA